MEFPRQECWSGLLFPSPGGPPNPGMEPASPISPALAGRFFTTEPPGKPSLNNVQSWWNFKIYTRGRSPCTQNRILYIYIRPKRLLPSLVAQRLKCLAAMWETWVQSLSQEDPLEKERATHSSILARKNPWIEEPGGLKSMRSQKVRHD